MESLPGLVSLANTFVTVKGHNIHVATSEEKALGSVWGGMRSWSIK